jgi:hypothetical protein
LALPLGGWPLPPVDATGADDGADAAGDDTATGDVAAGEDTAAGDDAAGDEVAAGEGGAAAPFELLLHPASATAARMATTAARQRLLDLM